MLKNEHKEKSYHLEQNIVHLHKDGCNCDKNTSTNKINATKNQIITLTKLFILYVPPKLEFNTPLWSPYLKKRC